MKINIVNLEDIIFEQQSFEDIEKALNSFDGNISEFTSEENTLLHIAAKIEDSSLLIKKLIDLGLDINSLDNNGCTPLYEAVNYECPNNCKTLLDLGADISISNNDNITPLVNASAMDYFDCVKVLVANGAEVDYHAGTKKTALNSAVYNEADMDLIDYLIDNGADVNSGEGHGTPLMSAIYCESIDMVEYLIEKGAKIKGLKDNNGKDALEVAQKVGDEEIIDYLKGKL